MPHVDQNSGELVLRIVYDGAGEAGKTTNIAKLRDLIALEKMSDVESPGTQGPRTQFFDWLDFPGGFVDWRRVRCQIVTVPGQPEHLHRRRHLLQEADAIVFVADSRESAWEETRTSFQSTRAVLRELGRNESIGMVVQANKQDLDGALSPETLRQQLDLPPSTAVIRGIASQAVGVLDSFIASMRLASDHLRSLLQSHDIDALGIKVATPESLYAALQAIDEAERQAIDRIAAAKSEPEHAVKLANAPENAVDREREGVEDAEPVLSDAGPNEPIRLVPNEANAPPDRHAEIAKMAELASIAKEARLAEFAKRFTLSSKKDESQTDGVSPRTSNEGGAPSKSPSPVSFTPRRRSGITGKSTAIHAASADVISLLDKKNSAVRNLCDPSIQTSIRSDIDLSAGHVWPPVAGRALLANAVLNNLSIPTWTRFWAAGCTIELNNAKGWTLHSQEAWHFDDEAGAKNRLLQVVRLHVDFLAIVPKSRVLFIAPDDRGWRLWMLTGPVHRLSEAANVGGTPALGESTPLRPIRDVVQQFLHRFDAIRTKLVAGRNILGLEEQDIVLLSLPELEEHADRDPEHFNELRQLLAVAA